MIQSATTYQVTASLAPRLRDRLSMIALILFLYSIGAITGSNNDPSMEPPFAEKCAFYLVYAATVAGIVRERKAAMRILRESRPLALLFLLAAISALWSAEPTTTLARSLNLLSSCLVALYFTCRLGLRGFIETLAIAITIAAALSALIVFMLPNVGLMNDTYSGAWRGLFAHKNPCGWSMVLGLLTIATTADRSHGTRRLVVIAAFLLCLFVLVASKCDTGMLVALFLALTCPTLLRSRARRAPGLAVLVLLASSLFVTCILMVDVEGALAIAGRDATLTGRTALWGLVGDAIGQHPVLGYGYGVFWEDTGPAAQYVNQFLDWLPGEAHNGFLDIALNLGVVGEIVFLTFLVVVVRRASQLFWRGDDRYSAWPLMVTLCLIVSNLADSTFLKGMEVNWIVLVGAFLLTLEGASPPRRVSIPISSPSEFSAHIGPAF